jgi:hypothetical protein
MEIHHSEEANFLARNPNAQLVRKGSVANVYEVPEKEVGFTPPAVNPFENQPPADPPPPPTPAPADPEVPEGGGASATTDQ